MMGASHIPPWGVRGLTWVKAGRSRVAPRCRGKARSRACSPTRRHCPSAAALPLKGHGGTFGVTEDEEGAPGSPQPGEFPSSLRGSPYLLCLAASRSRFGPAPIMLFFDLIRGRGRCLTSLISP